MEKKFVTRIQKLTPRLPDASESFSTMLTVEPDDEERLEKKGKVYAVFDIAAKTPLDSLLISKVVHDVLHDSYFQSENASPIQALEKAVYDARDKVSKLLEISATQASSLAGGSEDDLNFNIVAVALWGDVLYLVQYGVGGSFLMREENIKPINASSEGSFTVASGVVKDGDVVIIATLDFVNKYPPESLVNMATPISTHDLTEKASAVILKFTVDSAFSEAEAIDFNIRKPPESKGGTTTSLRGSKRSIFSFFKRRSKKNPVANTSVKKLGLKVRRPRTNKIKNPLLFIIPILLALFIVSIFFSMKKNKEEEKQNFVQGALDSAKQLIKGISDKTKVGDEETLQKLEDAKKELEDPKLTESDEAKKILAELNKKLEEAAGVERVNPEVFYDIKLSDEKANASEIVFLDNTLVISDNLSGKLFVSSATTPKFEAVSTFFPGIRSIYHYSGDLSFIDDEGLKVYDFSKNEVSESSAFESSSAVVPYLSFAYSIKDDAVIKYVRGTEPLEESIWVSDERLKNAISLAVNSHIYVLTSDGNLIRYYSGAKDTFEVVGLRIPLADPVKIVATINTDNVYIADRGNRRVVVVDEGGKLVRQFVPTDLEAWADMKGITVSQNEDTLYVLSGSKVYTLPL